MLADLFAAISEPHGTHKNAFFLDIFGLQSGPTISSILLSKNLKSKKIQKIQKIQKFKQTHNLESRIVGMRL